MQFPLGSGLFGMEQPDPNQQFMTGFGQNYMMLKPPRMKLGSGMFDTEEAAPPSDFRLGSGLFGQQMPQPNIQQGGPTTPPQPAPMQQQPAPGGGETPTWDQKFGSLLNNPALQFGLSLLGSSHSANPWGSALNTALSAQMQSAQAKHQQALAENDKARVGLEGQRVGLEGKKVGLQEKSLEQSAHEAALDRALKEQGLFQDYDLGKSKLDIERSGQGLKAHELDLQAPLWGSQGRYYDAQAGATTADTGVKRDKLSQDKQIADRNFGLVSGLFSGGSTPVPPIVPAVPSAQRTSTPMPQPGAAPQAPPTNSTPAEWQAINTASAAGQPQRQSEQLAILQEERANEKDPKNQAALDREIARVGGQPAQAPTTSPQQASPGMGAIRAGAAAGMLGMPGSGGMVQYGQALNEEPRKQAAEARAQADEGRKDTKLGLEVRAAGNQAAEHEAKKAENQANAVATYKSITGNMQRLDQSIEEVLKHPGLADNTGLSGAAGLYKLTQNGRSASVKLDTIKNQLLVDTLSDLQKDSKNGSSGFSPLSDKDAQIVASFRANLDKAQSYSEMVDALKQAQAWARQSSKVYTDKFNSLYGKQDSPNVAPSIGAQPQAPQGGAKGGIKFLGFE